MTLNSSEVKEQRKGKVLASSIREKGLHLFELSFWRPYPIEEDETFVVAEVLRDVLLWFARPLTRRLTWRHHGGGDCCPVDHDCCGSLATLISCCICSVLGAESVIRPGSLQWLAGALEGNRRLLVQVWTVVVDLDGEALDEGRSDGKGNIDIKGTRWECACGMTLNDADATCSWSMECAVCAHQKVCCDTVQEVYSVYTTRRVQWVASDWTRKRN